MLATLFNTVMNKRPEEKFAFASDSAIRLMPDNGIGFDAKGDPVYQGSYQHLLDNPLMQQLSLESEPGTVTGFASGPRRIANSGYNPYEHQAQGNTVRSKKPDLRQLSRWIDMKKRLTSQGQS